MEGLLDHFVKLERLPEDLEFPPDLKDRFSFDAKCQKLGFRGYMSKADFDRVCQLTTDWHFRRTLEQLFRLCVPEDLPRSGGSHRFLTACARLFSLG
jgi:hypothetical protein